LIVNVLITILPFNPSVANLALDVATVVVFALTAFYFLDQFGGVPSSAAHGLTACVSSQTFVTCPEREKRKWRRLE
jgi:hypothetical protein